jgi:hypothetical protein
VRIEGFRPIARIQNAAAGSVSSDPAQGNRFDHITDVAAPANDVLAVHVRSSGSDPSRRTLLLDAVTGAPLGGFTADHRVVRGWGGTAVLYREALHPEIAVVRLQDGG